MRITISTNQNPVGSVPAYPPNNMMGSRLKAEETVVDFHKRLSALDIDQLLDVLAQALDIEGPGRQFTSIFERVQRLAQQQPETRSLKHKLISLIVAVRGQHVSSQNVVKITNSWIKKMTTGPRGLKRNQ